MNRDIRIKVTSMQFENIKKQAELNGHKTISSFIRKKLFDYDETDKMLRKIYERISKK